jgi:hypothetical protein
MLVGCSESRAAQRRLVSEPETLDAARVSRYVSARTGSLSKPSREGSGHENKSIPQTKEKRTQSTTLSPTAVNFYIYDAAAALLRDRDGDQHYSEFRLRFDADTLFADALVYAKLYLRRAGETDWLLYHTSEEFRIYGQSPGDDYYVTTTLDAGFATSEYDVLIDLYEVGFGGIVATFGPQESSVLSFLPLEEAGLDEPIEVPGYAIRDVSTMLLVDDDADGHYSSFRIAFDPDADVAGYLYARIWTRPQGGEWIEEYESEDFLVDASGTGDLYTVTAEWMSGYPTAYYDVQIDLYESSSGRLAASAGSERPELSRVPLEDASHDVRPNPPTSGGGGAFGACWALAFLLLAIRRWRAVAAPSENAGNA